MAEIYCAVTGRPIDVPKVMRRVRSDADGAVLVFTGVVRNRDAGKAVVGLAYQAYEAMAARKLEEICRDVQARQEIGDLAVVHRVGSLAVGEVSVVVAVAAPHRDAAYKASREVIERLKKEVPIWKHERYADGSEVWLDGTPPPVPGAD